ncbi:hypothetical protein CTI14_67975, partial [Methylobacterium radiotolerans]
MIDGLIGLVGHLSERLDAKLASLADESRAPSENGIVGAVTGTVALVSRMIDGLIGLVGHLSERLDAKLASLADESRA